MADSLRVLLAHEDDAERDVIKAALIELDHDVVEVCETAEEMIALALAHQPNLIVASLQLPDRASIPALIDISESVSIPTIIVAKRTAVDTPDPPALDHVMAFLTEPVRPDEILPTIHLVRHRFEQFEAMRAEVGSLRQALEERTLIERAKAKLMRRENICEDEAYKRLRRFATDHRTKLVDVARRELLLKSKP